MPEPTADLIWLTGLAAEIEERLVGRKLRLWRRSGRYECWLDAGPGFSWIAELAPGSGRLRKAREGEVPQSDAEPPWRQWGGRRADGAEVVGVGVAGADRVLAISLHWKTRLGDDTRSELLIELGGRHTNAVLVAADGQIVDVIRPVGAGANRQRQILPGRTYVAPPSLGRVRFDEPWPWTECDDRSTLRHMSGSILAMSKPWARELCHGCDVDPDTLASDVPPAKRNALHAAAGAMVAEPTPCVVVGSDGAAADHLGFVPRHLPEESVRAASCFADAIDAVWEQRSRAGTESLHKTHRQADVRQQKRRLERRLEKLAADLAKADQVDGLKHRADLINAHLSQIPPGAAEAVLTDWFDPEQATITVALDPTVAPAAEAERLYSRARKLRASVPHIKTRLASARKQLTRLEDAESEGEGPTGMETDVPSERAEPKEKYPDSIRPRRYRTRDGNWLVLCGRNNNENDTLSLKVAAADDLWFHAHGCPGSHVVLKLEGRADNPSRQALAEAAAVAAYWSKARGASKVGVSYVAAKYVTKPRGAKPGTVTIRHEKLITVPPALLPLDDRAEG